MLNKKLKDLKVKEDEDPDVFLQKLLNLNAQMEKVGEGLMERRLIDVVFEKLPSCYNITKFNGKAERYDDWREELYMILHAQQETQGPQGQGR